MWAYTPGLKRKTAQIIRKTRKLPMPGEVLVNVGDKLSHNTEVAKIKTPGHFKIIQVAALLEINADQKEVEKYMLKKIGDSVEIGEVIARRQSFFGLMNRTCLAPTSGTIEHISDVFYLPGQVMIRESPILRSIYSYIPGTVVEVIPNEGVIIETIGTIIQGIFGIGGEAHGEIKVLVDSADGLLTSDTLSNDCKGKILVGGAMVDGKALQKAVELGVSGIVVGGIRDKDLTDFLGYEIGVAITGHEGKNLTLILTEGFGHIKMADKTFSLFKRFEGQLACINGTTQIRAGVIRPEIIIPIERKEEDEHSSLLEGFKLGLHVRIIVPPYFGALAKVTQIPIELYTIETESNVRVLEVELEDGRRIIMPRANVEAIDE